MRLGPKRGASKAFLKALEKPAPGVIGLDLSLRGPAAAWLPRDWKGDTRQVRIGGGWGLDLEIGAPYAERTQRMIRIADGVVAFCKANPAEGIYIEDHAYKAQTSRATETHEMTGVVKADVFRAIGLPVIPIQAPTARKILLQKLPRSNVKQWVEDNVRRLGGEAVYWTADQVDAVVVANAGADLLGWTALSFPGREYAAKLGPRKR